MEQMEHYFDSPSAITKYVNMYAVLLVTLLHVVFITVWRL